MDKSQYNISDEEMASLVETLDEMLDEEEPDFYGLLKECAWYVLHENPGYGFDEWVQTLMEEYPSEVVDAIGSYPAETYASLADMWETEDYKDEVTGESHAFKDWAEYFATDRSIEFYDLLSEARREIRRLEALSRLLNVGIGIFFGDGSNAAQMKENGLCVDVCWLYEKIELLEQRIKDKDAIIKFLTPT